MLRSRRLIEQRRNTVKGDTERIEQEDQKNIRDRKRRKRQGNIQRILEEFKGMKSTSCIKSGRKRTLIPKVKNNKGETITSRKGIAKVFGRRSSRQ